MRSAHIHKHTHTHTREKQGRPPRHISDVTGRDILRAQRATKLRRAAAPSGAAGGGAARRLAQTRRFRAPLSPLFCSTFHFPSFPVVNAQYGAFSASPKVAPGSAGRCLGWSVSLRRESTKKRSALRQASVNSSSVTQPRAPVRCALPNRPSRCDCVPLITTDCA